MPSSPHYVDRPPRIQPELPQGVVEIPNPPKEDDAGTPLWQSLVPIITIIGYLLVSTSGQGSNIAFMIPMALTVVLSTGIQLYTGLTQLARRREKRLSYTRRLVEMRRDMVASHIRQRTFYEYNYPEPNVILNMKGDSQDNRGGARLWERRSGDPDFAVTRLGRGVRPTTVEYKVTQRGDNDENPLRSDAERLATDSHFVSDVPITIRLYQLAKEREEKKSKDIGAPAGESSIKAPKEVVRHSLGIAGEPRDSYEFVYSLIAHYAAFHSPSDMQISVVGMNAAASHWSWLYALPHSQINPSKGQYRLYFEDCERIYAPVSGTITEINVQIGKTFEPGKVVARIRSDSDGRVVDVVSPVAGRVQEFGRVMVEGSDNLPLIDAERHIEKGTLLMRLEDFSLTSQQLDDEVDPRKDSQSKFGKMRKREVAGVPRFWKEKVWVDLDRRARRLRDKDENDRTEITLPFNLTIVDLLAARPNLSDENNPLKESWLDDLESEAAISLLLSRGLDLGGAVIFLVPQRNKVPSGCQSIIELKRDAGGQLKFLYAEVGLNSTRYVGDADTVVDLNKLKQFSKAVAEWEVRRSYGADMPRAVGLLPLYDTNSISGLNIQDRWRESVEPKRAEWPKMPLGMLAGQEPRYLHFFADADGVHGMIAGSTGSGKSELLMTMILSLAVKYDPTMVNFVLVDFKGGAAFEPFKELPHVVDFVTNLRGNAVARMFAAIIAELNRRQQVNQDTDMKDIVRYKRAGLHLQRQDNYPHLFIIIDEFAEMISNNAEYKAQLDSITRLGRALGVSLILAAQRPTGVTDQMRANIKFRIALRVETREESSELLRLPDAAYLPSIPGRGYMQVGSESLENIQVGYTGEPYLRDDYDPMERYENRAVIWEDDLGKEEDEPTYDVMVRRMAKWATDRYGNNPPWRKPWPNPLPTYLSLDQPAGIEVDYLRDEDQDYIRGELAPNQPFVLSPAIPQWLDGQLSAWKPLDWENRAVRAVVGLIDDPSNAKLQLLKVDLSVGHYMILGASGWGKSMFMRSVITSLIATHAPDELNLYILDFGSRALQIFEDVTHTGAYIVAHEKERVERLIRMLEELNDSRKEIISQANVANLLEYNQKGPPRGRTDLPAKIPAVLVVIDNFAEFRNSYEMLFEILVSLVREGLSNGIYFVVSGEQSNALGKLFNLIPERITLKLADDGEYSSIVGRGARPVDEIAGRGLRRVDRSPLELQVALPLGYVDDEAAKTESERLIDFLAVLKKAAQEKNYERPPQIDILENWAVLPRLLQEYRASLDGAPVLPAKVIMGRADSDLKPAVLTLDAKPHFIVTGPPSSGKSTALHSWILSLADLYSPHEVAMVMVDYQGGIVDYGGEHKLDELPHALMPVITEPQQFGELVNQLENEFVYTQNRPYREVFVIFDNYDDIDELASKVEGGDPRRRLGDMARRAGKQGLHFVVCGMRESLTSGDDMLRPIAANRYGLAMDAETAESAPLYASVPRSYSQMQLPRGRGFIVTPGKVALLQVAVPYPDPTRKTEDMDAWVENILGRGDARAAWLPMAPRPEGGAASSNGSNGAHKPAALTPEQRAYLLGKIAEKMGATPDILESAFPDDESLVNTALSYEITLEKM